MRIAAATCSWNGALASDHTKLSAAGSERDFSSQPNNVLGLIPIDRAAGFRYGCATRRSQIAARFSGVCLVMVKSSHYELAPKVPAQNASGRLRWHGLRRAKP